MRVCPAFGVTIGSLMVGKPLDFRASGPEEENWGLPNLKRLSIEAHQLAVAKVKAMENSLPDQNHIVSALQRDREQALAIFFEMVRQRLSRIVGFRLDARLAGRISQSDVIQETFVRASKRIDHYLAQPAMPFFVWLRLEVQQQLIELHRMHFNAEKRDVRREVSMLGHVDAGQTSVALAARLAADMTSPSQLFRRAEQVAWLEQTLGNMNEVDREVIALRHFEELNNEETAEVLQITTAAASKRYLRALKRLREICQQAGTFDQVE